MSYNNNRGNYGGQRGNNYRRNGGGYNNRNNNGANDKYVNASSVKKFMRDGDQKHRVDLDDQLTEEIGFSLTAEKAADLIVRLKQAMSDAEGDGGVYFNMYLSRKQNGRTGETFDGLRILVNKKNPPQEGGYNRGGGSFQGNGGGRRSYTPQSGTGQEARSSSSNGGFNTAGYTSNYNNRTMAGDARGAAPANAGYTTAATTADSPVTTTVVQNEPEF